MAATQTTDEMTYAEALDECEEADREWQEAWLRSEEARGLTRAGEAH